MMTVAASSDKVTLLQRLRESQAAFERQSREEREDFGKAMRDPNLQRGMETLKARQEQQRRDKP